MEIDKLITYQEVIASLDKKKSQKKFTIRKWF